MPFDCPAAVPDDVPLASKSTDRAADGHLQHYSEKLATELRANVMIIRRCNRKFAIAAAAPAEISLNSLDEIALDFCFRMGRPSGWGSEFSAGSDWLFLPVCASGSVRLALAVAARHCRRRFSPARFEEARQELQRLVGASGTEQASRRAGVKAAKPRSKPEVRVA